MCASAAVSAMSSAAGSRTKSHASRRVDGSRPALEASAVPSRSPGTWRRAGVRSVLRSRAQRDTCRDEPVKPSVRISRHRARPLRQPVAHRAPRCPSYGARMLTGKGCRPHSGKASAARYFRTVVRLIPSARAIWKMPCLLGVEPPGLGVPRVAALPSALRKRPALHASAVAAGDPRQGGGRYRGVLKPAAGTREVADEDLPEIVEQVPAVGDLQSVGGALGDGTGVLGRAVPGDDFNAGVMPGAMPRAYRPSGPGGRRRAWGLRGR